MPNMLSAISIPDMHANPHWQASTLFALWGVVDVPQAERAIGEIVDLLTLGSGNVVHVDVSENFEDGAVRVRRETRLSALAAYSLLTVHTSLFPGADVEDVRFFAGVIAASKSPVIAPTADGYDAPFAASAPPSNVVVLRTFLYQKSGSWDFADRFKSVFGKALKAAYRAEHGDFPPLANVEVSDDHTASICQYHTADLPLIERTYAEWSARHAATH
ncbi:MAG: hypothetical protein E6R04_03155 [Spirochaetes bacterium]|nr:MAG: hypothetical protein E6R04_03155 [Spirochaetota bacterium]